MWDKFYQLKVWVVEGVLWAEKELRDKTGPEKKKAVTSKVTSLLVSMVTLPWYLSWAKGWAASMLVGYLIDLACDKLNFLSAWSFADANLDEVQIAEVAAVLAAPVAVMVDACTGEKTVDERLDALYRKYGVNPGPKTSGLPVLPETDNYDNWLSKNLARREIACKCGCGFNILTQQTIDTFQALRDYIGKPIRITSGCRCPEHNSKKGGVEESAHIYGQALDMYVDGLSARQFGEMVKKIYYAGLLPHLRYCYLVDDRVIHVGTDEKARSGMWGW